MRFAQTQGLTRPTGLAQPDATNHEGLSAFSENLQQSVARVALTGVLKDGFYVKEAEQTQEMVDLCRQAAQDDPGFLLSAAKVSRRANFKLLPKLAVAALVSTLEPEGAEGPGPRWTPEFEAQVVDLLQTYSAGQLLELALVFKGKVFGRGLGRRAQRVLGRALAGMKPQRLEDMTLSDRDDLRRLLRLVHPVGLNVLQAAPFRYVLGDDRVAATPRQAALEALKGGVDDEMATSLIGINHLPFNVTKGIVPAGRKVVWKAILGEMSPLQVLLNLRSLDEKGVITPDQLDQFLVAQDLGRLRLVPHDVLRPIAFAPDRFREPLVAFLSRLAARPLPGLKGMRVGVALDISPSMAAAYQGDGASCWYLAATMATPILASCADRHLVFFDNVAHPEGGDLQPDPFHYGRRPAMRLPYLKGCPPEAILHNLLTVDVNRTNGTSIGDAIRWFRDQAPVDVLFLFTDEQQNGQIRGLDQWRGYLRGVNGRARLVVVNVSNTKWHMAHDGADRVTIIQTVTPLIYQQFERFDETPVELIRRLG